MTCLSPLPIWQVTQLSMLLAQQENLPVPDYWMRLLSSPDSSTCNNRLLAQNSHYTNTVPLKSHTVEEKN